MIESASRRAAAPFGPESISASEATAPDVPDEGGANPERKQTAKLKRDEPMWRKLNVLVGTLRDADEIIVLVHGEIAERGTHAELLARGGRYAALVNRDADLAEAAA